MDCRFVHFRRQRLDQRRFRLVCGHGALIPYTAAIPNYSATNATLLFYHGTRSPTGITPAYFIGATLTNRAGVTEHSKTRSSGFGIDGFNQNVGEAPLTGALPAPFNGAIAYTTSSYLFSAFAPTGDSHGDK